jgi:hypothetical protein
MPTNSVNRTRVALTLAVLAFVACHLGWEMLHGGVVAHHLLARPDLPSISNWWGLVLVPALAWFVTGRVQARAANAEERSGAIPPEIRRAAPAFAGAFAYGAAIAVSFSQGLGAENYLFPGLFGIALILPVYRGEYMLGFVLGMLVTFGGILPTIMAVIFGAFSWLAHFLFRFAVRAGRRLARRTGASG